MNNRMNRSGLEKGWKAAAVLLVALLSFGGLVACETASATVNTATATRDAASAARDAVTRDHHQVIPMFPASEERYDDLIGFEEFEAVVAEDAVANLMGDIRRRFYRVEDASPLEIVRHYQQQIEAAGGTVLYQTRDPQSVVVNDRGLVEYFNRHRQDRGMSTYVFDYFQHPGRITEYVAGVVPSGGNEVYVLLGAGRPDARQQFTGTRYEIVTVVAE
ncbi:MAG: hypothetical protein EA428_11505 [Spirochaetaceae bacterium]|nr:MAG: hypothetical protein EA428_11505 [Spirochaetaceae bacterium]